jgi:hypothetical protein
MLEIQPFETLCHRPCPDLSCYSLNAEQKAAGLKNLSRVRANLRETLLAPLRTSRRELQARLKNTDIPHEAAQLTRQIRKIDEQAVSISKRWS